MAALIVAFVPGGSARASTAEASVRVIRVPQDAANPQAAVAAATAGDLILVDRGTYAGGVFVPPAAGGITIRGVDRNAVVFDGQNRAISAVEIHADGVTLENLTVRNYTGTAIYWDQVRGFAGRYLTVSNVGAYGMYAFASTDGLLEQDLASGAADSAFYVGACSPCRTTLTGVTARYSAIGFSGTNAGGDLTVRDSVFERNGTGILPNSYDDEPNPPQREAIFTGNVVRGSGSVPTPSSDPLGGLVGIGIGVAGGSDDRVDGNTVEGSARYGIAVFASVQPDGGRYEPAGNVVTGNTVGGSGRSDLALAAGSGAGNTFAGNGFTTSLPPGIEGPTAGDRAVARDLVVPTTVAYTRAGRRPSYTTMPAPEPQPTMPDALPPPPAGGGPSPWWLALLALPALVVAVAFVARFLHGRHSPT